MSREINPQPDVYEWPTWLRIVASLLIVFHLACVFVGPWAVQPPPASELSQAVAAALAPYLKFMSIDNGYRYFAPDPMPGHILKYALLKDGDVVVEGEYPDREQHRPRQLYHRYFMVSETAFQLAASAQMPPLPPGVEPTRAQRESLAHRQDMARRFFQGIADNLLNEHPECNSVRLTCTTHIIPTPIEMAQGTRLTDEKLYRDQPLGKFTRSGL